MIPRIGTMGVLTLLTALAAARPAGAVGEFIWPNTGKLTATHVYPGGAYHGGSADIAAGYWTPIGASRAGRAYPYRDYYGANIVVLTHENGYSTGYAHMVQWPSVYNGQWVAKNQHLGWVGASGWATGPHCHFAIMRYGTRLVIPYIWIGQYVTRGYWVPGSFYGLSGGALFRAKVVSSYLNVRTGASTGYGIVGTLGYGAVVDVYATYYGWYKIIYGGYYRWIAGWYTVRV